MAYDDFVATYKPYADSIAQQTGQDPQTVLGIIAQETTFGTHVAGNNVFGISPGGRVAGYPNIEAAGQAYINLMRQPLYANVPKAQGPQAQIEALRVAGYNKVNPNYSVETIAKMQQMQNAGGTKMNAEDAFKQFQGPQPGQAGPSIPADQAFTQFQQGMPAAATPPIYSRAGSATAAAMGIPGPPSAAPAGPPAPAPDYYTQFKNALTGIGDAAARGYQGAPTLLTPGAQNLLDASAATPSPFQTYALTGSLLSHGANALLGGAAGAYTGLQEGITQALDPIGRAITGQPGLGRDVASGLDLIPAFRAENLMTRSLANPAPQAPQAATPLGQQFQQAPFAPGYKGISAAGPTEASGFPWASMSKEAVPTADAAASGTVRFTNAANAYILGHLASGHPIGGIAAIMMRELASRYGPQVASAVGQGLIAGGKNPLTSMSAVGGQEGRSEPVP